MAINEIILTVSIIFQLKGGVVIGSATGFFYTKNDSLFLVTNQHVMRDEKNGKIPDVLRLWIHTNPTDLTLNDNFDISLYEEKKPLWKIHPKFNQADIAIIKLNKDQIQQKFFIKSWSKTSFLPKDYRLDPGEDVFIMGYPLTFYDSANNLPILRNAMIASIYRVPFLKLPLFLTDANLHPGLSGSPVITKPKSTWIDQYGNTNLLTGTVYFLVGIHSGTVEKSVTGGQEIGLGAAWYAELIEEIASLF